MENEHKFKAIIDGITYTVYYNDAHMRDHWIGYITGIWDAIEDHNKMVCTVEKKGHVTMIKDTYDLKID